LGPYDMDGFKDRMHAHKIVKAEEELRKNVSGCKNIRILSGLNRANLADMADDLHRRLHRKGSRISPLRRIGSLRDLASLTHVRPPDGGAHGSALDDEIVHVAQHHEVFDIVPPEQNQLALPVEIIGIDHVQSRARAKSTAILSGSGEKLYANAPKQNKKGNKSNNDRKADHILSNLRYF